MNLTVPSLWRAKLVRAMPDINITLILTDSILAYGIRSFVLNVFHSLVSSGPSRAATSIFRQCQQCSLYFSSGKHLVAVLWAKRGVPRDVFEGWEAELRHHLQFGYGHRGSCSNTPCVTVGSAQVSSWVDCSLILWSVRYNLMNRITANQIVIRMSETYTMAINGLLIVPTKILLDQCLLSQIQ